jgi:hypothetical protein
MNKVDRKYTSSTMFGIIKSWKYFDNELIGDEEVADAYVKTCTYNITKSSDIFTLQSTYITNKIKKEFFKPSYIPKKTDITLI